MVLDPQLVKERKVQVQVFKQLHPPAVAVVEQDLQPHQVMEMEQMEVPEVVVEVVQLFLAMQVELEIPLLLIRLKDKMVVVLDQIQALVMIQQQVAAVVLVEQGHQVLTDQPVERVVLTLIVL